MGMTTIKVSDIPTIKDQWIPLKNCKSGEIFVSSVILSGHAPSVIHNEGQMQSDETVQDKPLEADTLKAKVDEIVQEDIGPIEDQDIHDNAKEASIISSQNDSTTISEVLIIDEKATADTITEKPKEKVNLESLEETEESGSPKIEEPVDECSKLKINIIKARNLEKKGMFNKADPYVKVSYGKQEEISVAVNNNLNPEWNFEKVFEFNQSSHKEIMIKVYDKDTLTKDDFMGSTTISTADIPKFKQAVWISLQECKKGEVLVSAEVLPPNGENIDTQIGKDSLQTGKIIVVDQAKPLDKDTKPEPILFTRAS